MDCGGENSGTVADVSGVETICVLLKILARNASWAHRGFNCLYKPNIMNNIVFPSSYFASKGILKLAGCVLDAVVIDG